MRRKLQFDTNKKKVMGITAVLALIALSLFLFTDFMSAETENIPPSNADEPDQTAQEDSEYTRAKGDQKAQREMTEETEFLNQEVREELDWIAQAYEQQAKYPVTSLPIQDPATARTPEPFEEAKVDMRLPDDDGNLSPINLSASVDKIQYFTGETIIIQLSISGLEGNESVSVEANIKHMGRIDLLPSDVSMSEVGGNQGVYQATVDTNGFALPSDSHELLTKIVVEIDEKSYVTTVPFFFSQASAQLDNVSLSRQEGAYLVIPLEYSVTQAGYYFASAYLDDAATGRPLLALQTEGRMRQGNDRLVLKAHHQALKDAGSPGPYRLRVTRSFRGGEPGKGNDVPTAISQRAYAIPAFAFENYDDIPYSDPAVNERLEALRGLAGDTE